MDTRLLEYFVAVAEELHVTEAARQLSVAQSTVSAGLRSLESELGVRLFERTSKTVRLTAAGEDLLPEARRMVSGAEQLRAAASGNRAGQRGRLRIGTFTAMEALLDLPDVLREFHAARPGVDVLLTAPVAGSSGLLDDLQHGRLDLAFTALPTGPGIESVLIGTAGFVALLPPSHRLARARDLTLADLAKEPWVDVLPGYGNRRQVEQALAERALSRRIAAEVAGLPSVPAYVAAGVGVAVVPDVVDSGECAVRPIRDHLPDWALSISARTGEIGQPAVQAFVDLLLRRVGPATADRTRWPVGAANRRPLRAPSGPTSDRVTT